LPLNAKLRTQQKKIKRAISYKNNLAELNKSIQPPKSTTLFARKITSIANHQECTPTQTLKYRAAITAGQE
jgi:Rps23 Pro-64 3,4-dihydroxylase Tpa1-like proline 4-hydroxylase